MNNGLFKTLGELGWAYTPLLPVLITLILALGAFYYYVTRVGQTSAWAKARGRSRETAAWAQRLSSSMSSSNVELRERREEEFVAVIGRSSKSHRTRGLVIALVITLLMWVLTASPVLTPTFGLGFVMWWNARASGKLDKARNGALDNELVPYARHISRSMERSISLHDALGDLIRTDTNTTLKRSIRRALSSTRTLEAGLRAEAVYANQSAVREFFEILAEGATSVQRSAITHQALDRYIDLNQRRRTVFQKALQTTAQARGTRLLMLAIIPIMYTISSLRTGTDLMWHSVGGNVVTAMVVLTLLAAFVFSNMMIRGILKDF